MIKIGFDVGGVLSKYPEVFIPLINSLLTSLNIEVHVLSDMHPKEKIIDWLQRNKLTVPLDNIHSCDYVEYGERCKAIKSQELGLHIMIDDFIGYVAEGAPVRLLVMPDASRPYYADEWQTDGSEGNFGRKRRN